MMPPKKSKAARSVNQDKAVTEEKDVESKPAEEREQVNVFDVEIIKGKRQRKVLPIEQNLTDWIDSHFVESPGNALVLSDAYIHYVDSCVAANTVARSLPEFCKVVKEKFPSGIAVKEGSPFVCLVRVKKEKGPRSKGTPLKMKDIIFKTIEELGNPQKGVRFVMLKLCIAKKYPALGVDKRPRFLLSTLERCVQYGQIQLVRGVGMCGLYRMFGPSKSDDEEDKENHKAEQSEDKEEFTDEEDKKKEEDDQDEKHKSKPNKTVQRKSRKPKKANRSDHVIVHSAPQKVEDAFMLAMTFMVEPKEASVKKILKYVTEYYDKDLGIERLRKCLEKGCEKGYWQQVTGQGLSGTFRLLMNNCDPSADNDLFGQVTNALIACTEPKYCSATLLKSYLIEYHPEFDLQNKPYLFKKALERALKKNLIRQLRGIGATGSFQLNKPFTPSPTILKGEDTEDDYEISAVEGMRGFGEFDIASFQNAYQPRPTKSRGHGREASKGISSEPLASLLTKGDRVKPSSASTTVSQRRKRPVYYGEDESVKERVKKAKKKSSQPSSGTKRQPDEKEHRDPRPAEKRLEVRRATPAKKGSKSAGNTEGKRLASFEGGSKKSVASKSKRSPTKYYKESSNEDEDDEVMVPRPKSNKSKRSARASTSSKNRKHDDGGYSGGVSDQRSSRKSRVSYAEDSYTSDDDSVY